MLCCLRALNAILTQLGLPNVEREFTDNLPKDLAKQEMDLMHSTSATMIGDLYHDPRGYYAADVLHHAIQTQTGLTWNRWDGREPSVDPETLANSFLIGAGDRWTVVVKDYNGHWVHKDDTHTLPIVFLYKFLSAKSKSGSVYYFGDLKTKTIHDRVTALRPQKRASQHHSKGQSKPRGGRKTPSPNKAKKQPPISPGHSCTPHL